MVYSVLKLYGWCKQTLDTTEQGTYRLTPHSYFDAAQHKSCLNNSYSTNCSQGNSFATADSLDLSPLAMVFNNGWHDHQLVNA